MLHIGLLVVLDLQFHLRNDNISLLDRGEAAFNILFGFNHCRLDVFIEDLCRALRVGCQALFESILFVADHLAFVDVEDVLLDRVEVRDALDA